MAFCEKCGKEIGPDGVCDCQKASAAPEASATPAVSAAPASSAAPAASAVPANNNSKLIGIVAVAAVAVVLLILIFSLFGGGSYKTPFKDLQKLINKQSTDLFAYQKVMNDPVSAKFTKTVYDVLKSNGDYKDAYKESQEDLKDFYDDIKGFKITKIEIKKAEKMKSSELRTIKKMYDKDRFKDSIEELDDMDSDDIEDLADSLDISKSAAKKLVKAMKSYYKSMGKVKVQAGYNVKVVVHAKYEGETDKTDKIEDIQVLKINGKWYISNASSFLRNISFDKDLDDVSLYGLYNKINFNLGSSLTYGF